MESVFFNLVNFFSFLVIFFGGIIFAFSWKNSKAQEIVINNLSKIYITINILGLLILGYINLKNNQLLDPLILFLVFYSVYVLFKFKR